MDFRVGYLQPVVKTLPYVIKDTTDFYVDGRNWVIPGGGIFSTDVVGLYPHIPRDGRSESMKSVLSEYNRN